MRILGITRNNNDRWDIHISFEVDDPTGETALPPEVVKICEWTSNTFTKGFVILEQATKIIAGGASDNALSWKEQWNSDDIYNRTDRYQLRCHDEDVTLFMLKYK